MTTLDDVIRAVHARPPDRKDAPRRAAVAVVLTPEVDVLLIRRAPAPNDPWSGHVAFPGGRVEPTDDDALDAAIRETAEEVGLRLPRDAAVGALDDLMAVGGRPGLVISPFVFAISEPRPPLDLNHEVADTRWVPLRWLLSDEGRGRMRYQRDGLDLLLPEIRFPEPWGDASTAAGAADVRLWGLTLRMLDDLLDRLDGRGVGLDRIRPPGADGSR